MIDDDDARTDAGHRRGDGPRRSNVRPRSSRRASMDRSRGDGTSRRSPRSAATFRGRPCTRGTSSISRPPCGTRGRATTRRRRGVYVRERQTAADVDAARRAAISYAAYGVLAHRYAAAVGGADDARVPARGDERPRLRPRRRARHGRRSRRLRQPHRARDHREDGRTTARTSRTTTPTRTPGRPTTRRSSTTASARR